MKKSNKYNYMAGKQITDEETGKRVYEISSYRLPSVTTILGATKNTEFLTKWKAKVGETEAERIKNVSSARGTRMHKFLESYVTGVGTMILQNSDARRVPWPIKLWRSVLRQYRNITGRKLRYIIRAYTRAKQTLYARITILRLLLTSNKLTVLKRRNGSKIIIYKSQPTPWLMTTSTEVRYSRELSWYARLTYIIKNLK